MLRIAFVACALAAVAMSLNPELDEHWAAYTAKYKKDVKDMNRREIFEKAVQKINRHNLLHDLGLKSYRLGLNKFADLTNAEFRKIYNGYRGKRVAKTGGEDLSGEAPPKSVDWRKKGYVTGIKDQGQCGSCWAFSTTGSVEGAHFKKTGKLVSLSEQNLVDCSGDEGNMGCDGGLMDQAFDYIMKNKGVDTEKSYPYKAVDGNCHFKVNSVGATITKYVDVKSGSEKALQSAVAKIGPVSVAIDASQDSFQLYSSGVYDEPECSSTFLDHGVLAVGYDTSDDGQDYWIVKNSWGSDWGQEGYIWMSRNKDNQCGIATQSSYPIP